MLHDVYIDNCTSLMQSLVIRACSAVTLSALSACDRRHREACRPRLRELKEEHDALALASHLGCSQRAHLRHLRALTLADGLPREMWSLLGKWLRKGGCLECVHCLRCESWWRRGELPWIELEPVRAGELKRMSLEERFTLNEFDTEDGLLRSVLECMSPEARSESAES